MLKPDILATGYESVVRMRIRALSWTNLENRDVRGLSTVQMYLQ